MKKEEQNKEPPQEFATPEDALLHLARIGDIDAIIEFNQEKRREQIDKLKKELFGI